MRRFVQRFVLVLLSAACSRAPLQLHRSAFTRAECEAIVELFLGIEPEQDARENPLLPHMEGRGFGVLRTNRFDDGALLRDGRLQTIHARLERTFEHTLGPLLPRDRC